jgi:hypothetical protein
MIRINLVENELFGKPIKIRQWIRLHVMAREAMLMSLMFLGITVAGCVVMVGFLR